SLTLRIDELLIDSLLGLLTEILCDAREDNDQTETSVRGFGDDREEVGRLTTLYVSENQALGVLQFLMGAKSIDDNRRRIVDADNRFSEIRLDDLSKRWPEHVDVEIRSVPFLAELLPFVSADLVAPIGETECLTLPVVGCFNLGLGFWGASKELLLRRFKVSTQP